MRIRGNLVVALGVLVGTTVAVGFTVREDGESLSEVALAGVLYAAVMVPLVLPGVVLYLVALRRLAGGRGAAEARMVAVATAPVAVVLLAPSLLVHFGAESLPWIAVGTAALGLLARLPRDA